MHCNTHSQQYRYSLIVQNHELVKTKKICLSLGATVLNSLKIHGVIDLFVLNMPKNHHAELCGKMLINMLKNVWALTNIS